MLFYLLEFLKGVEAVLVAWLDVEVGLVAHEGPHLVHALVQHLKPIPANY